ncbi:hypothetical protein K7432_000613 [Basidiobolus ranarum]|uniref:Uncharacterized protein n=1 Tax=Basidiobolus ranarum TaxID=34480 RepID=A0ABR2X4A1_9FUNG
MSKVSQEKYYDPSQLPPPPPYTSMEEPSAPIPPYGSSGITDQYSSSSSSRHQPGQQQVTTNTNTTQNLFSSIQNFFTNQSSSDQPPPCFSRQPPQIPGYAPGPFPPLQVPCKGKNLEDGFPLHYPIPQHMLARDILEMDWTQFINDISGEGRLTITQRVTAGVLPMTMHVGAAGFFISRAIQRNMLRGNIGKLSAKIEIWNYCFFNPRGVSVTLYQGLRVLSGEKAILKSSDQSSSSNSSSEEDSRYAGQHLNSRSNRREERQIRRDSRRQEKRERRQRRREQKQADRSKEPFYLLVESR